MIGYAIYRLYEPKSGSHRARDPRRVGYVVAKTPKEALKIFVRESVKTATYSRVIYGALPFYDPIAIVDGKTYTAWRNVPTTTEWQGLINESKWFVIREGA